MKKKLSLNLSARDLKMIQKRNNVIKKLYLTECVEYLRVKIAANLIWQCEFNDLFIRLNRANLSCLKL